LTVAVATETEVSQLEWCDGCATHRARVAWSDYAGAMLCFGCYSKLPEVQLPKDFKEWKYKSPAARVPSKHEVAVAKLRHRLERRTGRTVFYMGPGEMACFCPSCAKGTVSLTIVPMADDKSPNVVWHSQAGGVDHCSLGCTVDQIEAALARGK
jgi:hypothetical protein